MAAQMSEMNDPAVVQDFSSPSVLAVQRLLYRWVWTIRSFRNIFEHLRCPELCQQLWQSLALHACVAAIAAVLLQKEEKSILLFCVPVDTGRIEPQMFHLQQLPQNNALWIFNNQARGKLMRDRSKLPRSLVRLRRRLQKREGKTRSCVLRGRKRLCCLLKSQSCYLLTAGLHLPQPHSPFLCLPSCVCTWLGHWRSNSSCLTSSAILQPRASQGRGRRLCWAATVSLWVRHIQFSNPN